MLFKPLWSSNLSFIYLNNSNIAIASFTELSSTAGRSPSVIDGVRASAPSVTDGSSWGRSSGSAQQAVSGLGSGLGFRDSEVCLTGSQGSRSGSGLGSWLRFETSLILQLNKMLSEEKKKERKSSGCGNMGPFYTTEAWHSCRPMQPPTLTHPSPTQTSYFQTLPSVSITSLNLAP